MAGDRTLYGIAPGYVHRSAAVYYDDTENTDNWQREVYEAAREIMKANDLHSVYDVGCGSGYKLVNTLGDFDSVGFDVPQTVAVLKARYPDRKWFSGPLDNLPKADLVICGDVIEHVSDPAHALACRRRERLDHHLNARQKLELQISANKQILLWAAPQSGPSSGVDQA
jgi:SAM-dependent methyltransferase